MDTIEGGKWLPQPGARLDARHQGDRARAASWRTRSAASSTAMPDGTLHGKAFAGQTFDRTVHKGDLTGIEIINRLMEQVWARPIRRLEEHRARRADSRRKDGASLAGVLLHRRPHAASSSSSRRRPCCSRPAAARPCTATTRRPATRAWTGSPWRCASACRCATWRWCSSIRPALLAGPDTRMTGTVLEEGLRGSGGHLLNGAMRALHGRLRSARASARRATSSRARCTPRCAPAAPRRTAALYIKMSHLGPDNVRKQFKGMVERCADCGFDLAGGLVEVVPTAHYFMGGVVCEVDTSTELPGLFVAGEDAGGVHGANRLGGNGVANSTVFGGIAGETMARDWRTATPAIARRTRTCSTRRCARAQAAVRAARRGDLNGCASGCSTLMWDDVGVMRDARRPRRAARRARRDRGRAAGDRHCRQRPRLQHDLARLAQSALADRDRRR